MSIKYFAYINNFIFFILFQILLSVSSSMYADEPEEFLYVKTFTVGKAGGVSASQSELLRKEFLESMQKLKMYKLIGPEAEEAIRAEQSMIESEGGAGMMCRADECRRRLLKVSSADVLAEGTVERVAEDINQIQLEVFSRKVISSISGEKKEQSINVYSVKYKVLKNEKDYLRIQSLAATILAKKVSGISVSKDEEDRVSGLKPLGRDNLDNLARSMILPGWGQYTKEHYEKAFLFYALTAYGITKCYGEWQIYQNSLNSYQNSATTGLVITSSLGGDADYLGLYLLAIYPLNSANSSRKAVTTVNQSLTNLGAFYLFNLIDAYFSNKRYYIGSTDGLSFDFRFTPIIANSFYYNGESSSRGNSGDYSIWLQYKF